MKVSIVIPTFNSQEFIEYAINSILSQTYKDIECVVVDGGSKDNTVNILKSFGDKITFVSEKDKGVFDALNKGIKMAKGDIIGWLGFDDFYADNKVVEKAVRAIDKENVDICWGDLFYVDQADISKVIRYWKSSPYRKGAFARGWQMPHFASFVRKSAFEKNGYFNIKFKIAADYDFFLRLLEINNAKSFYIPEVFTKMRAGGQSNRSVDNIRKGNVECYEAWAENGLNISPIRLFLPKPFSKIQQYYRAMMYVPPQSPNSVGKKSALVCGAGGFIGSHMVKRLKKDGYFVKGVDLKKPDFVPTECDEFVVGDLRDPSVWESLACNGYDELYQFAADMGGAGYLFTGKYDADILHNSAMINLYACEYGTRWEVGKVFYASSACVYPMENQEDPNNPKCTESSVYPANPDSDYGFEKLFSERVYQAFSREYGLSVRIARFHNVFGPEGTYDGGKEKAPAAICRKVALASNNGSIEIWGDGEQTRSFLYIDEAVEAVSRLMKSNFPGPVNIGSDEMVTINKLAEMASGIAGKKISLKHIAGPLGVRGRTSDNALIKEKLGWAPSQPLEIGLKKTYEWIKVQTTK